MASEQTTTRDQNSYQTISHRQHTRYKRPMRSNRALPWNRNPSNPIKTAQRLPIDLDRCQSRSMEVLMRWSSRASCA